VSEPPNSSTSVKVLRSVGELAAMRDFWTSCRAHRDGQFDFYHFIVDSYPEVVRPHVIAVYRDGAPVALLLGRLERRASSAAFGYLKIPTPSLRLLNFLYGGRLGDDSPEIDRLFIESMLASLRASEADAAMLHYPPIDSPLYRFARALPGFWRRDHFPSVIVHRRRSLPAGKGAFMAGLSSNERNNQKRRHKKLASDFAGKVLIERFDDETAIDRLARDAEIVAAQSYQRALGVGFRDDADMRRRLLLEARRGALRGAVLYVADRPCSFWITAFRDGVLYNDYLAYDQAYARYAPGMLLVIDMLERICDAAPAGETRQLDFGMGEMEWKARLGDQQWLEGNLYIYGPTLRAGVTNIVRSLTLALDRLVRAMLAKTTLIAWLKRIWRQRRAGG
jgi:hypothetical protein